MTSAAVMTRSLPPGDDYIRSALRRRVITPDMEFQERVAPSRPIRLGTRRRPPTKEAPERGASWPRQRPTSLDTHRQLQTSSAKLGKNRQPTVKELLLSEETESDRYRQQLHFHQQLMDSYHSLWQDYAAASREARNMGDDDAAEKMQRLSAKWEKRWLRVHDCRTEWIAFRATCCGAKTQPVTVPVGCNDRLCPLCAWDRSRAARKRIRKMFDRLTHPVLITLTVPNVPLWDVKGRPLRKSHYEHFRKRVRQFLKQHEDWIKGGVYSLETTYNRAEKSWHIHVHILADVTAALPLAAEMTEFAGCKFRKFTLIKRKLEFDWLRLWTKRHGKKLRTNAAKDRRRSDVSAFAGWLHACRAHTVRRWTPDGYVPLKLAPGELARRNAWNRENRRVVDVRPVQDRDGAAREVLKYITKVADFSDCEEAVEGFANAVAGARLIQTFGSWYGALECVECARKYTQKEGRECKRKCADCGGKIVTFGEALTKPPNPDALTDWGELKCACGCNFWKPFAIVQRRDVEMDESGRWWLKRPHDHNSASTVSHPTIRAENIVRGKGRQWTTEQAE